MKVEYNRDIINIIKENIFYDDEYVMSSDIIHDLKRVGQNGVISQLQKEKSNEEKNRVLRSVDIYPKEGISINKSSNLIEYVFNERMDFEMEDELIVYTDIENSKIPISVMASSKISILDQGWRGFNYVIKYNIKFKRNTFHEDLIESIALSVDHKVYKYTVLLKHENNLSFQDKYSNLDEFYDFYKDNYESALYDFCGEDFIEWMRVNEFKKALSTYESFNNKNDQIALQNFLQYMGYDVKPNIYIEIEDNKIIIKNRGDGFLYGDIEGRYGIILKKTQWSENDNIISFKKLSDGEIIINSNGGRVRKKIYHEKEIIKQSVINLKWKSKVSGKKIYLDNKKSYACVEEETLKVTQSNKYVKVIFDDKNNRLIIKNKAALFLLIKMKYKKKQEITTDVNIHKDCIIYKYKIKISLW